MADMAITIACTCGKQYSVKDEFAGLQVQCPDCNAVLTIPGKPKPRAARGTEDQVRVVVVPVRSASGRDEEDEDRRRPQRSRARDEEDDRPRRRRRRGEDEEDERSGSMGCLPWFLLGGMVLLLIGTIVVIAVVMIPEEGDKKDGSSPVADGGGQPKQGGEGGATPAPGPPPPFGDRPWTGHQAPILAVGFTLDGRNALSASGGYRVDGGSATLLADNSVRTWEAISGKGTRLLDGFRDGMTAAAFTPDGRHAVIGAAGQGKDGTWAHTGPFAVQFWDLQEPRLVSSMTGHTGDVLCLAISPDGRRALSGGADGSVRLWDLMAGREIRSFAGHTGAVLSVALAGNGPFAASGGADKMVRVWDLEVGNKVQEFAGHQDAVWAVAVTGNGKQVLSGGGGELAADGRTVLPGRRDFIVRLWDVVSGEAVRQMKGHGGRVGSLALSADGALLLSGGEDALRLWQVSTGQELKQFTGHRAPVRAVAFSASSRRALSGSEDGVLLTWELPLTVPELLKELKSPDAAKRAEVVRALGRYGSDARSAIPALLEVLAGSDEGLRRLALTSLGQIGEPGPAEVPLLVPVLRNGKFASGRRYALEMLGKLGAAAEPAAAALAEALGDADPAVRRQVIALLAGLGPRARDVAWKALVGALRDTDAQVSEAAADALSKLGPPPGDEVETLRSLLAERAVPARRYALKALSELGPTAVEAMPALLKAVGDSDAEMRGLALQTLGKVQPGNKQAVEAFVKALDDPDLKVCAEAAQALVRTCAESPQPVALAGLLRGLEHRGQAVVKVCSDGLQKTRLDRAQVPILQKGLESKRREARLAVIAALGRLGPDAAGAVDALCQLFKDGSPEERQHIAATLGAMGPAAKGAGPTLAEGLKGKDRSVVLEIALVLARLDAPESEQGIAALVRALKLDSPKPDEQAKAVRERAHKALVDLGKRAAVPLARALGSEFKGGPATTVSSVLRADARVAAIQTLEAIGADANVPEVIGTLAQVAARDPVPQVRQAARDVRVLLESAGK
jgi:WD40 repeat protein